MACLPSANFFTLLIRTRCTGERARWGCMMVNAHAGPESTDPQVRQRLNLHHDRLRAALRGALDTARQRAQLHPGTDPDSSLPSPAKHVVLITASVTNECHYCVAAHSTMALRHGATPDTVTALRAGKPLDDPKLEAVHTFTHAVVASRGWVTPELVDAFLAAGYTHRHVLDVILGVGMKTLSNYTNHIADTPLDPAWAEQEWTPANL